MSTGGSQKWGGRLIGAASKVPSTVIWWRTQEQAGSTGHQTYDAALHMNVAQCRHVDRQADPVLASLSHREARLAHLWPNTGPVEEVAERRDDIEEDGKRTTTTRDFSSGQEVRSTSVGFVVRIMEFVLLYRRARGVERMCGCSEHKKRSPHYLRAC